MRRVADRPGLQPERTALSWERTSLGFLAIGALVLLRHAELALPGRFVVAALAFALALAVIVVGRRRAARRRIAVLCVGWATVALAGAVCVLVWWST
nr:DUF202 domain-containing protein [Mycolicibacterium sediminis]